ncbi:helix-turn-helix domain-containing protein [Microbacterium sp. No. 7]|uniref:helix-turn-helix domain-containing protein n=1 Tax=Microbacterium sp. No. 7 TaxID=1714373 RepID=UPI0006D0B1FF|nr:helix-turn-helix domain-containing protein [Microbacterium sp. No. 7]ALJ20404.1 hypothetical protein AOA12_11005 [Microbacterium sp. No. 7]
MSARLTVAEVAVIARKHPVTVRKALEGKKLHGTQASTGGRWSVREDCLEAWLDGEKCVHQAAKITPLRKAS